MFSLARIDLRYMDETGNSIVVWVPNKLQCTVKKSPNTVKRLSNKHSQALFPSTLTSYDDQTITILANGCTRIPYYYIPDYLTFLVDQTQQQHLYHIIDAQHCN